MQVGVDRMRLASKNGVRPVRVRRELQRLVGGEIISDELRNSVEWCGKVTVVVKKYKVLASHLPQ